MNDERWKTPCAMCGATPTGHSVGSDRLCCACYVAAGHPPADWHPACMKAAESAIPEHGRQKP